MMSQAKKCEILNCVGENNKLFRSPQNPRNLYKWKHLIGTNKNEFFICELHFDENCINYEKVLKDSALPSLLLNENEMNQEGSCECCFKSIYINDRKYYSNSIHQEIFKLLFQDYELNSGMICAKCNDQFIAIERFKYEIEKQQRAYKSIDYDHFEPKVKLECDNFEETAFYEEELQTVSTASHFIHVKSEYNNEKNDFDNIDYLNEPSPQFEPKRKKAQKNQRQTPKGTRKSAVLYHCDFCQNFTADNKKEYADHIKLYHAINPQPEEKKIEEERKIEHIILDSIDLEDVNSPVTCDICGKINRNKKALIYHMKSHHIASENEIKCTECEKSFKDVNLMTRHRNRCHSDGTTVWCLCGNVFDNQRDLRKCRLSHQKNVKSGSDCDECDKSFNSERQLLNHKNKIHGNGKRFWCVRCSSMYGSKEEQTMCVKSHYNDSLKNVIVQCPICSKEMLHNSLKIHMKSTHTTVRDAVCHQCGKSFVTVSRLTIHVRQVHNNGQKPYQCAHCPLRTALKKAMKEHLFKRHASQRKTYQCPICLKVTQEVLDRHMALVHPNGYDNGARVNPETNMYHCPNCVQQFSQMKRYEQHVQENICANYGDYEFQTGENGKFSVATKGKFKCKICDSVQSSLARLRRHMNYIHSGEQNCPVCNKRMKSKRSVISHLRKVHKTNFTVVMNASSS
ncbi:hypothetical protein PVAND_009482 [Polypedilum vanderplanki]|uniref:C2H2-type domain-containing protein n=1 Tax=Polypedilum vanderplanki TaxID=319348 RepID=A0A9J6CDV4_POLVA|nr:hypothetical protein PVAND_009482 [Polypedilum vanderplanki]